MGATETAKTTPHAASKDGRTRNRGFHAGEFPTRGPFLIHQPAGPTGKRYYLTGQYAKNRPPAEGWIDWLALEFGAGNYKVASKLDEPAFVVITEPMVARAQRRAAAGSTRPPEPMPRQRQLALADEDDDEDDDEPEDELDEEDEDPAPRTRRNPPPPADPVAAIADRLAELERIRAIFGTSEPAAPPPPDLVQTLISNPALVQMLGRVLAPPNPSPTPATPPINPAWRELITNFETHGIGPDRLRQMLTPSPPPAPANDAPHDAPHDELEPT